MKHMTRFIATLGFTFALFANCVVPVWAADQIIEPTSFKPKHSCAYISKNQCNNTERL